MSAEKASLARLIALHEIQQFSEYAMRQRGGKVVSTEVVAIVGVRCYAFGVGEGSSGGEWDGGRDVECAV